MRASGFTLIELLITLTLASLVMSLLCELFLANQRSFKTQLALSKLQARTSKITAIFRYDIHRASKVSLLEDGAIQVDANTYRIEKEHLVVIDTSGRKISLVEEVNDMHALRIGRGIDVSMRVFVGSLGETLHVFTAFK